MSMNSQESLSEFEEKVLNKIKVPEFDELN